MTKRQSAMANTWALKKVTITGFRGYHESRTIDLTAPFTLLEGPQRAGKSSTLAAIEWTLFGDEVAKKEIGIDERKKGWKVRNARAGVAVVELVLTNDGDELKVRRTDEKKKNSSAFSWELNSKSSADEGQFLALLGISPKDYFSSVHLHQEVVRALLTEEPSSRRSMLDRLLGLSDLRNILDGIKQAKLGDTLREADREFNRIEAQLSAIVTSKRRDLQEHKDTALAKGVDTSNFTEKGAEKLCLGIRGLIDQFAQQCGSEVLDLPSPNDLQGQQSFSSSAILELRKLRDEQPDLRRQQELLQKQSRLQDSQIAYSSEVNKRQGLESSRQQIEQKDGTREQMQTRIDDELNPELKTAKRKRTEIDKRAGVIEEAIKFFEATQNSEAQPVCPVCEGQVSDAAVLHSRLGSLRQALKDDLDPIQRQIDSAEAKIRRLQNQIEEHIRLTDQIAAQNEKVTQARTAVGSALGRDIADTEDPNAVLNRELVQISTDLEQIKDQVAESNKKLNAIEDAIGALDNVLTVLGLDAEIDGLLKIKNSDEYKAVEAARNDLEQLAADVEVVRTAVEEELRAGAKEKLQMARNAIAGNFRRLANRPDFQEIEIDPESYEIIAVREGEKVSALTIFNQGDLNCAGISIFLGLGAAQEVSHRLGFLILDDPSQSMDITHKENLVALLNALPDGRQTVVSTSECDFATTIVGSVLRTKKHYRFDSWSHEKGAKLQEVQV